MATGLPTDLLPDHLRTGWRAVEEQRLPTAAFERDREQAFEAYRTVWAHALSRGGSSDLAESLVNELAGYLNIDPAEVQRRCAHATAALADDWRTHVDPADSRSVERYYDGTEHFLYDLTWWHTLTDDVSPLSYVLALHFAEQHGCRRYCDFGSGVGAGTLLFAAHDFEVTPADISSTLLAFTQWRLTQRGIQHHPIDLKTTALPPSAFDFITAMDVFEHLTDPAITHARPPTVTRSSLGNFCSRFKF